MVDQSGPAFRLLARKYGATLAYSPMVHSRLYYEGCDTTFDRDIRTCPEDKPYIIQVPGNVTEDSMFYVMLVHGLGCREGKRVSLTLLP